MNQNEKNLQTQCSAAVSSFDEAFQNASGEIPYNMTNDYMFRAVLQSNHNVLRRLICSLLHLAESEVKSVEITNPIICIYAVRMIKSIVVRITGKQAGCTYRLFGLYVVCCRLIPHRPCHG